MQLAAHRVGLHADPDEIVGGVEVEGLGFGQGHYFIILLHDFQILERQPAGIALQAVLAQQANSRFLSTFGGSE